MVAKVSRAMGVDATGKAAMVSAGDSWVIRSMSYPYKVGPVEEQPRMLLLQPEQDGFTLAPGRYIVVVKGMGYDFTVDGIVTDPDGSGGTPAGGWAFRHGPETVAEEKIVLVRYGRTRP